MGWGERMGRRGELVHAGVTWDSSSDRQDSPKLSNFCEAEQKDCVNLHPSSNQSRVVGSVVLSGVAKKVIQPPVLALFADLWDGVSS